MNKFAVVSTKSAKVNRLILANIAEYAQMQELLENFIANPSSELAEQIDEHCKRVSAGFSAVQNAINVLAETVVTDDVDNLETIDVSFDKNGARLL